MDTSRHSSRASHDEDNISVMLSCEVCMEVFDDNLRVPKLLPCHHCFCRQCLAVVAGDRNSLDCPNCRKSVTIPPEGVSGFQTNFYVTRLKELMHQQSPVKVKTCRKHKSEEVTHFCSLCEVPVCRVCCMKDHLESAGHKTIPLSNAIRQQADLLGIEIAETRDCMIRNQRQVKILTTEMSALFAAKQKAADEIDVAFDSYIAELNARRRQVKENLDTMYADTRVTLADQVEGLKQEETILVDLAEECKIAIDGGVLSDIMAYRAKAYAKNQEIKRKSLHIRSNKYMTYDPGQGGDAFMGVLHDLGELHISQSLPCIVRFNSQCVIATLVTTLSFNLTNSAGEPLSGYPLDVSIKDIYDDEIPCYLQCRGNGRYEVTFRPQVSGTHHIRVMFLQTAVLCEHAINVQSNNPVARLGTEEGYTLEYPRDVSTDAQNNIYIMDTGHGCIQIYDKTGHPLRTIEIDPDNPNMSSCGVCVDPARKQLVCPEVPLHESNLSESHRLLIFSMDGTKLQSCDLGDYVKQVLSVSVMTTGHLVVTDYREHFVYVFDRQCRMIRRIGGPGETPGKLRHPTFVCLGENDRIFVSDSENHRIQVYDRNGNYVFHFGSKGNGKGEINMPFGLAADIHGNLIVVDGVNRRIQIFKQDNGEYVGSIESLSDPLCAPRGVAVTNDGYILVADRNNNCIKKFKYLLCSTL